MMQSVAHDTRSDVTPSFDIIICQDASSKTSHAYYKSENDQSTGTTAQRGTCMGRGAIISSLLLLIDQ